MSKTINEILNEDQLNKYNDFMNSLNTISNEYLKVLVRNLEDKQEDNEDKIHTIFLPQRSIDKQKQARNNYYHRNADKIKEQQKEYVENNKELIQERLKKKKEELAPIKEAKKLEKQRLKEEAKALKSLEPKRPRGRPRKIKEETKEDTKQSGVNNDIIITKKRGRPRKY